ncbi:hypothetical protein GQ600_20296 [Phytophthora cactorum]|nr:hypothetical protein GQ600_20296 [Phytophthora cactorum]
MSGSIIEFGIKPIMARVNIPCNTHITDLVDEPYDKMHLFISSVCGHGDANGSPTLALEHANGTNLRKQMTRRHGGGSHSLRSQRKRKKTSGRKAAAHKRAVAILGEERLGLSERVIRAIIPVGGSRVARLRKVLELGIDRCTRAKLTPWHAFTEDDVARFKAHCATWILEDGFLCAHRRPRQYFTEPKLTLKILHFRYVDDTTRVNSDARTLSYSRLIQYVRYYFPGVRLKRTAEDVCDSCVRLDILLLQPDISEEEREGVLLEKSTHLNEAIAQRRFDSNFVKEYTALHAPQQVLPTEIIPDTTDDVAAVDENDIDGDERATTKISVLSCTNSSRRLWRWYFDAVLWPLPSFSRLFQQQFDDTELRNCRRFEWTEQRVLLR